MTDEAMIAKVMATTGIDRAGAEQAVADGKRLAAQLIEAYDKSEADAAPKKRKAKAKSPTSRTLDECKRRGWIAGVVERHIPFPKPMGTKIDLFGVIDLVVIVPGDDECTICNMALIDNEEGEPTCGCCGRETGKAAPGAILAIQATASAAHHAHRRAKIIAEPRAKAWVDAGGRLELWSWSKRGDRGKAKRWAVRVETYAEMVASGI